MDDSSAPQPVDPRPGRAAAVDELCRTLDVMPAEPAAAFSQDGVHRDGDLVWVPLRGTWINARHLPEELVRQEWVRKLHVDGGYALAQMDQERRTVHGRRSPRADIIVWASGEDKANGASPALVVETKAGQGAIRPTDYWQGESYARAAGAQFLVLANETTSLVFKLTTGLPGKTQQINDWPKAADLGDATRLQHLVNQLEVFDREQFQRVLFECHTLLRDNHAMTPDRAFDTMSKILFIKLHIERTQSHETFTTKYLEDSRRFLNDPKLALHEQMFANTKSAYADDDLFADDDRLDISASTFVEIVGKLERFNLSNTGEDIKGIAFERFLGRTFRGELGQFFTPRPVVDFIVEMIDPREGEIVCDPAAGSGGFLIRTFEYIREQIVRDINTQRAEAIASIEAQFPEDASETELERRDRLVEEAVSLLAGELASTTADGAEADTRAGRLSWRSIYGTDKEPRAARTAKMNMIMHGDGHGGIHWHDGLIDTHGVYAGRFDVVITNPPFGATVTAAQKVGASPEADVPSDPSYIRQMKNRYGRAWVTANERVISARGTSILEQFEIGRGAKSRKTEQLFLERCFQLLKPGGRLGIVLPNGNLNASSQAWLRRWAEGKAFLRGVVALPAETFRFSGASVTASVLFMEKFTDEATERWEAAWADAERITGEEFGKRREDATDSVLATMASTGDAEIIRVLAELAELDVRPKLRITSNPQGGLVRAAARSTVRGISWEGTGAGAAVDELKRAFAIRVKQVPDLSAALSAARKVLKALDDEQTAAMWSHVRTAFDYPVFMAAPTAVGITATGDTGPHVANDLPAVLQAWRDHRAGEDA